MDASAKRIQALFLPQPEYPRVISGFEEALPSHIWCRICHKKLLYRSSLLVHQLERHAPKLREKEQNREKDDVFEDCSFCGKSFKDSYLPYHKMRFHKEQLRQERLEKRGKFVCDICGRAYEKKGVLEKHIVRIHTQREPKFRIPKERDRVCQICSESFLTRTAFQNHLKTVHKDVSTDCDVCGKKMSCKTALLDHIALHTGVTVLCSVCGKQVVKVRLRQHMMLHGPKNYVCQVCSKAFSQPAGLNIHMRTHGLGRPQKTGPEEDAKRTCNICGKMLGSYMSLYTHKKQTHGLGSAKVCPICGKFSASQAHYDAHMSSHSTENIYVCHICNSSYRWERSLGEHLKRKHNIQHTYKRLKTFGQHQHELEGEGERVEVKYPGFGV